MVIIYHWMDIDHYSTYALHLLHGCGTQDDLIERLGGVDEVAELTGRKKRMVKGRDGRFQFLPRATDGPIDTVRPNPKPFCQT